MIPVSANLDLYTAIIQNHLNFDQILTCYREYMNFVVGNNIPTQKEFLLNMEEKMLDSEFLGDTQLLLRNGEAYGPLGAWELVKKNLIEKL